MSSGVANINSWQWNKMQEECGVFGIFAPGLDAAQLTYYGLYALQHRGQESAGIAVRDGQTIKLHKGMGLVSEIFSAEQINNLQGHAAIGHVRYASGPSDLVNAQPLLIHQRPGMLALAQNGNLTNRVQLREMLYNSGAVFQSNTDSEIIINLIARYGQSNLEGAIMKAMIDLQGAYSVVVLTQHALYAVRDPHGFRPLCLGKIGDQGWVVSSESCALDTVGAKLVRDINPGEIVRIDHDGVTSLQTTPAAKSAHCVFEYIYFARPDSTIDGYHVNSVRREMGRQLAREFQVDADIVIPVPDSGTAAAWGYAEQSGIPFEEGLMKNRYIGRTFIRPTQQQRDIGVRLKMNPMREILAGKRVIAVDDSLVRGTTSKRIVRMLREAGAKEVHLCISSPPVVACCHYGINTSDNKELIAASHSVEEICKKVGADGLHYLSQEGLRNIFEQRDEHFCYACFDNNYPVPVPAGAGKTKK